MLRVNIVGIGPGNPKLLTGAALEAINQSTILIGDKRMLANFASEKRFMTPSRQQKYAIFAQMPILKKILSAYL